MCVRGVERKAGENEKKYRKRTTASANFLQKCGKNIMFDKYLNNIFNRNDNL